jgi:hypothetical protein
MPLRVFALDSSASEFPTMFQTHLDHLSEFTFGWLIVMVCCAVAVVRVRTPRLKLLLTRTQGVLGGASLVLGGWWFSATTTGLLFAVIGVISVVSLNFFTIRICPHCAKTVYPRTQLMLGFCPRCGADLGAAHERTANWPASARDGQVRMPQSRHS